MTKKPPSDKENLLRIKTAFDHWLSGEKETILIVLEQALEVQARFSRQEERIRAFEILHKYAMMTVKSESLDLIEQAQKEILNPKSDE